MLVDEKEQVIEELGELPGELEEIEQEVIDAVLNEQGGGQADRNNVLILGPCNISASCCACNNPVEISFIATSEASIVFDTLLISNRFNLLCPACAEDIKRL